MRDPWSRCSLVSGTIRESLRSSQPYRTGGSVELQQVVRRHKRINHAQRSARERSSQPVALKNGGRSARELQRRLGAPAFSVSRLSQNPIVLTCFGICFERKQIPAAGTPPPLRGAARRRCDDASVKVRGQLIAPSRGVTARTASLFVEPRDLHAGIGGSGGGPLHG